jgi:hypothetical protein
MQPVAWETAELGHAGMIGSVSPGLRVTSPSWLGTGQAHFLCTSCGAGANKRH